jgi:demethylmenaquinone methyltransferase/2-methoxy-6-polyprenyl-1,4-benzoquinol methylase
MFATDRELPITGGAAKRAYVREIFSAIAPRYDLLNHVLSLNIDRRWRRLAVDRLGWERAPEGTYLDICSGTMDLAAELGNRPGFRGRVIATDFVQQMLMRGRGKSDRAVPCNGDALALPFADAGFDGATVGFGVRNLMDLNAGLAEAARVLKPGARLVILEFSMPSRRWLRVLYSRYFLRILPVIGRFVSKHRDAYTWLPESVLAFPEPEELAIRMRTTGFHDVSFRTMMGGICAIHVGTRASTVNGQRSTGKANSLAPRLPGSLAP